jgi:uncharacterized protein
MEKPETLRVRVVYALPDQQISVDLNLAPGATAADAINRSNLLKKFPEAAERPLACAVFGRAVPLSYELREGDRVEILRPLIIDPKQSRREAANRSRAAAKSRR